MICGPLNKYLIFHRLITYLKEFGKYVKYPPTRLLFCENVLRPSLKFET